MSNTFDNPSNNRHTLFHPLTDFLFNAVHNLSEIHSGSHFNHLTHFSNVDCASFSDHFAHPVVHISTIANHPANWVKLVAIGVSYALASCSDRSDVAISHVTDTIVASCYTRGTGGYTLTNSLSSRLSHLELTGTKARAIAISLSHSFINYTTSSRKVCTIANILSFSITNRDISLSNITFGIPDRVSDLGPANFGHPCTGLAAHSDDHLPCPMIPTRTKRCFGSIEDSRCIISC